MVNWRTFALHWALLTAGGIAAFEATGESWVGMALGMAIVFLLLIMPWRSL